MERIYVARWLALAHLVLTLVTIGICSESTVPTNDRENEHSRDSYSSTEGKFEMSMLTTESSHPEDDYSLDDLLAAAIQTTAEPAQPTIDFNSMHLGIVKSTDATVLKPRKGKVVGAEGADFSRHDVTVVPPESYERSSPSDLRLPEAPIFIKPTTDEAVLQQSMDTSIPGPVVPPPTPIFMENTSVGTSMPTFERVFRNLVTNNTAIILKTKAAFWKVSEELAATFNFDSAPEVHHDTKNAFITRRTDVKDNHPTSQLEVNIEISAEDDHDASEHFQTAERESRQIQKVLDANDTERGDKNLPKSGILTQAETNTSYVWASPGIEDCFTQHGPLRPLFNGSKFFQDNINLYKFKEAVATCQKYQLVIGDMDSIIDHRSIAAFYDANLESVSDTRAPSQRFWLGMNDRLEEGIFVRGDNKTLTFQSLHTSQPDDSKTSEDCTSIGKETWDGPVGQFDDNCNERHNLICMFQADSICLPNSSEMVQAAELKIGMTLLINVSRRAYFVANFQATWKGANSYCRAHRMRIFDMDDLVALDFFFKLLDWEGSFFNTSIPTIQYWTGGYFRVTHLATEVLWHTEPRHTEWDTWRDKLNYTFTGVYKWSKIKKADPGGLYNYKHDLCVTMAFENKSDPIPYVRNSNCKLTNFFVCMEEYNWKPESENNSDDRKKREWVKLAKWHK